MKVGSLRYGVIFKKAFSVPEYDFGSDEYHSNPDFDHEIPENIWQVITLSCPVKFFLDFN